MFLDAFEGVGLPRQREQQALAGKLRVVAVSGARRSPRLPDVPTFKELGVDIIDHGDEIDAEIIALMAQKGGVEVGAGTTVLWDFGQEGVCPDHHFQNAALLMTRVLSKPAPGLLLAAAAMIVVVMLPSIKSKREEAFQDAD